MKTRKSHFPEIFVARRPRRSEKGKNGADGTDEIDKKSGNATGQNFEPQRNQETKEMGRGLSEILVYAA
jgi:hypothetical protein